MNHVSETEKTSRFPKNIPNIVQLIAVKAWRIKMNHVKVLRLQTINAVVWCPSGVLIQQAELMKEQLKNFIKQVKHNTTETKMIDIKQSEMERYNRTFENSKNAKEIA